MLTLTIISNKTNNTLHFSKSKDLTLLIHRACIIYNTPNTTSYIESEETGELLWHKAYPYNS